MTLNLSLRFATLVAGIILCQTAYAQSSGAPSPLLRQRVHSAPRTQPAAYYTNGAQAKITGVGSRLIGEVNGNFDASHHWLPDSTVYHFSGGHGGDYENPFYSFPIKYDSSIAWRTDATTLGYKLYSRHTQTFNPLNDLVATQVEQQWSGSAWVNSSRILVSYDAANRENTLLWQNYNTTNGSWINNYRIVDSFNSTGFYAGSSEDFWIPATNSFQTQSAYLFTPDANNNRAEELYVYYDNVTMMLKPLFRIFHRYNTANLEINQIQQNPSGSSWVNADSTAYLLNGANQVTEFITYSWIAASATWTKASHELLTLTPGGIWTSVVVQNWDSTTGRYSATRDSTAFTYNSNGQRQRYYYFSFSSSVNNSESHYYYEPYTTTGIANRQPPAFQEISVYPVPADGLLHVSVRLSKPQLISCNVYDATGKVVCAWQADAAVAYTRDLSISGIPSGSYWLRIYSADGMVAKAFIVSHR